MVFSSESFRRTVFVELSKIMFKETIPYLVMRETLAQTILALVLLFTTLPAIINLQMTVAIIIPLLA